MSKQDMRFLVINESSHEILFCGFSVKKAMAKHFIEIQGKMMELENLPDTGLYYVSQLFETVIRIGVKE